MKILIIPATLPRMIRVVWPSTSAEQAQVWRVLDLSGLTSSVRQSRNYTKAGFVYLDGNRVYTLRATISLGTVFTLELRFPNGVTKSKEIFLIPQSNKTKVRSNKPLMKNYRG